jgi:hypothetical protein
MGHLRTARTEAQRAWRSEVTPAPEVGRVFGCAPATQASLILVKDSRVAGPDLR